MKKNSEPDLCPDCPLKYWWAEARQNLLDRQYLKQKNEPGNLKVCIELRRLAAEHGRECPYYKDTYFRSEKVRRLKVQVDPQVKAEMKGLDEFR